MSKDRASEEGSAFAKLCREIDYSALIVLPRRWRVGMPLQQQFSAIFKHQEAISGAQPPGVPFGFMVWESLGLKSWRPGP